MNKKIAPQVKLKIISLSQCFWFWSSFFSFYSTILGTSKRKLENRFPRDQYNNKFNVTEIILDELEENGRIDVIRDVISSFYNLDGPLDKDKNPRYVEALQCLKEFKEMVKKDISEEHKEKVKTKEVLKSERERDLLEIERRKKLGDIKDEFLEWYKVKDPKEKQKRGFRLEKAFYRLLELEKIVSTPPYKKQFEQIDGHFRFNTFDYLVEIKRTDEQFKQKDVSIFDGKIGTKGQSTRGFVLSVSGFDQSALLAATSKGAPRLIFMQASEFIQILEGLRTFSDLFQDKEDKLVRLGKVL